LKKYQEYKQRFDRKQTGGKMKNFKKKGKIAKIKDNSKGK